MNTNRKSRNTPHNNGVRYSIASEGERDTHFLHKNGKNKWPLLLVPIEEIAERLRAFRFNGIIPRAK